DTLVVFTSDHGEMLGDHELMLKGPMLYEQAVRVPLVLRWPAVVPAGTRSPELVQWIDLSATILTAAGLTPIGEGQDLLPLATTRAAGRGWALTEYRNSGHPYADPVHLTMLRRDQWKLVVQHASPTRPRTGELYDLSNDPDEQHNLWHDPVHRDTRTDLQEFLLDVLVATEDRTQPRLADW
ncbi:MAG TPA: sulfatase/phosphatase domain-containing protein, partial [Kribbella sp.]|nr:sulfatase/phosphatase domain-containing protein [Kribbella sp.]